MRIELNWSACPIEVASLPRWPVPVVGRSKFVDHEGERIRSGKQKPDAPERLDPCCGELVKEFPIELESDFSLDSIYPNSFHPLDRRITEQNFQTCVYARPTQYMAELYRLIKWENVCKSGVINFAWENRRALPGAFAGAHIGTHCRRELPTDRWIHLLDMPENLYFTGDGDGLSTTKLGYCCGDWRFELDCYHRRIQRGEYVVLLRQLTIEPPWQRHGWT